MPLLENKIHMSRFVTTVFQIFRKSIRNVNIAKKFYYATSFNTFPEDRIFINWNIDWKSSGSSSGWSAIISSGLIPEASISKITSTGHLIPRIQGLPWQISESIVIRFKDSKFSIQKTYPFSETSQLKFPDQNWAFLAQFKSQIEKLKADRESDKQRISNLESKLDRILAQQQTDVITTAKR